MDDSSANFPIVGIGASAGGVEALEGLFREMPPNTGCGFVIVTHLSSERRSLLPEIIARYTAMPVHIAEDGAMVEANQVHVLPADAILSIERRRLQIRKPPPGRRERKPIDIFLSALAIDQGECAVGIILSGGDGDGTLGVKAIKERGGLTMAQVADGSPPQHSEMPASAIASGMVDLPLPVGEMGRRLAQFAASFGMLDSLVAGAGRREGRAFEQSRKEIYALLRNQVGHDFSGYKVRTFVRRVERRMQVHHLQSLDSYIEKLRRDPREVGALFRDLLINVTNFFRDADAFETLATLVIPKLFEGRGAEDTVRVWIPGCATGEEVFSIAILMREHLETLTAVPRVQIFATDIDEPSLAVARAARYPEALLDSVSAERRKRFFTADGGSYVVAKEVRDLCVFSPHSVIRDPPFSRLDMISCRNLLIYFGPDVQNQVIPIFHYALRPGGYLFLGTSENVTQFGDLFQGLDKKHRIFRSREGVAPSLRVPLAINGIRPAPYAISDPRGRKPPGLSGMALRQAAETQVLERFSPPHVVVNRDGDIVFYSSRTGKYLEPATGAPTRQLLTLARKGLRLDLRTLLREAIESEQRVTREGLTVEGDEDRVQTVTVTIEPIVERGEEPLFLIMFTDLGPSLSREEARTRTIPSESTAHLERELRDTRDRLQSLIEEYETALEELKSSNEELVSVNEELQSTNEELEASKEELQSLNEELHTVNGELSVKIEALDQANNDLHNLFESTRVATVFLDESMRIRSFTPAVSRVFNILPSDRGRPLTDLSSGFALPDLTADVAAVFETGRTIERTIEDEHGAAHFLLRLVPYRNADQKTEGVVLTFVDITSVTRAEALQRVLIADLNGRVKNVLNVVMGVAEQTLRTTKGAAAFRAAFVPRLQAMGRSYDLLSREQWRETTIDEMVRLAVEPFGLERVDLAGPEVRLKPRQALSLGMVLHEMAANAVIHGALGDSGRVQVAWDQKHNGAGAEVHIDWVERDGPEVAAASPRGFGLELVERETADSLGGEAVIGFGKEGLTVNLKFPLAGNLEDA